MSDLYEEDIVLWSERQAELLRRRAAGELVNEAELDWPNIAEEIEAVANEQRFAVESLLVQAIVHLLKAEAWPDRRDMENWLADSMRFRGDAASRFVPSMRQRIDMARIWRRALRAMTRTIDGIAAPPWPSECRFTLDWLLSEEV
jgi:Domain of unknown function DUF29